jgi:hypothetical protein
MKSFELVKREDHYGLYTEDGHKIASTLDGCNSKLSIKNCEAVERGYDIEDLVDEKFKPSDKSIYGFNNWDFFIFEAGFKKGFEKAMEFKKDKLFTTEDVKRAMDVSLNYEHKRDAKSYQEKIDFLKSLQQTEWDVEIVMENSLSNGYKNQPDNIIGFIAEYKSVPKLDENGCLILKPIKNV